MAANSAGCRRASHHRLSGCSCPADRVAQILSRASAPADRQGVTGVIGGAISPAVAAGVFVPVAVGVAIAGGVAGRGVTGTVAVGGTNVGGPWPARQAPSFSYPTNVLYTKCRPRRRQMMAAVGLLFALIPPCPATRALRRESKGLGHRPSPVRPLPGVPTESPLGDSVVPTSVLPFPCVIVDWPGAGEVSAAGQGCAGAGHPSGLELPPL